MQTVHFPCTHCQKLMAIPLSLLGRTVRCPSCKEVVQAPTTAPAPPVVVSKPQPAASNFKTELFSPAPAPTDEPDSIFGEQHDDDLFGTKAPTIVLPTSPPVAPPPVQPPANNSRLKPSTPEVPQPKPTPPSPPEPAVVLQPEQAFADFTRPFGAASQSLEAVQPVDAQEYIPENVSRVNPAVPVASGGGAFIWILLGYAALATGAAVYLLYDKLNRPDGGAPTPASQHPYQAIPDFFGQFDRADRKKVSAVEGLPKPDLAIPPELRVKLGQSLTLGQLEVTPTKVEHGTVKRYRQETGKPLVEMKESPLVYLLHLKLKNISDDVYLFPNDPAFNRRRNSPVPPYNSVMVEDSRFVGGPFSWPFGTGVDREFIEGQQADNQPLRPREERETTLCTDYDLAPQISRAIEKAAPGPGGMKAVLWRVQLRTGLVTYAESPGQERDVSVTTVFGVEFQAKDVGH